MTTWGDKIEVVNDGNDFYRVRAEADGAWTNFVTESIEDALRLCQVIAKGVELGDLIRRFEAGDDPELTGAQA